MSAVDERNFVIEDILMGLSVYALHNYISTPSREFREHAQTLLLPR